MKLTLLAVVVSTVLTTPIFAAPNPEPLEIALSIDTADQVAPEQARIPLTASVTLHGATPEAVYPTVVQVNGKSFPIGAKLSVSYITVQGFAGCVFYGIDGSKTSVTSWTIPQTVPVGPPQTLVNGTCRDPNTICAFEL
ncbi:hypothetical protein MMC28_001456 [Mycoblastus sanguinarius]|nr:hypothetical protein [Mycoblastus sanguinarius]